MISLRRATPADRDVLYTLAQNEAGYFERCFDEGRFIVLGLRDEQPCGYGQLNVRPRYALYQKLAYPEIQDVNVLSDYRRQGVATAIIHHLEEEARHQGYQGVGISVGITRHFGPAQRLYWKLGYEPDGYGATHDRIGVEETGRYASHELCLMLLKSL